MSPFILIFIVGAALGSYLQTMTGFALGIVVTGVIALSGLTSIGDTADALSVISIFNALVVLPSLWRHIDWSGLVRLLGALLVGMIIGVFLLELLTNFYSALLRILAGLAVLIGGLSLIINPEETKKNHKSKGVFFFGFSAGMMSGLFALPGPPVVYYYYKQAISLYKIRSTLIAIFAILSVFRLCFVYFKSGVSAQAFQASLYSIPVVIFFSWLGMRFPLKMSDRLVKKSACYILIFIGLLTILLTMSELYG